MLGHLPLMCLYQSMARSDCSLLDHGNLEGVDDCHHMFACPEGRHHNLSHGETYYFLQRGGGGGVKAKSKSKREKCLFLEEINIYISDQNIGLQFVTSIRTTFLDYNFGPTFWAIILD